jgi:hypothetical protein
LNQPRAINVPAIQYWFTGGAVAAFLALLGAVSTLGYAWYRAAVTEMEIGVIINPGDQSDAIYLKHLPATARALGIHLVIFEARTLAEIEAVLAASALPSRMRSCRLPTR